MPVKERLIEKSLNICTIDADCCAIVVVQRYGGAIFVIQTILWSSMCYKLSCLTGFKAQGIYHDTVSPDWPVVRPGDIWDRDEAIGQMGQGETGQRLDRWGSGVAT